MASSFWLIQQVIGQNRAMAVLLQFITLNECVTVSGRMDGFTGDFLMCFNLVVIADRRPESEIHRIVVFFTG
jgi:hypothetical protein